VKYTDNFDRIEADIFGYLQSDPLMGARAGVRIEPGAPVSVVATKVSKAIGAGTDGKVGLGYCVLPIEDLIDDQPETEFGPLRLPIMVDIVENVLLNAGQRGPQIPIRWLAAYAQKILKCYSAVNLITDNIPEREAISVFTKHDDDNLRVCRIKFHTYESDPVLFQQVSSPGLTPNTAVSSTPGVNQYPMSVTFTPFEAAEIWFTTDGSHPWSGNAAATKWDGATPVAIAGPCLFRARGFNTPAGLLGSKSSSIYFA
jgi:hypothetical protein